MLTLDMDAPRERPHLLLPPERKLVLPAGSEPAIEAAVPDPNPQIGNGELAPMFANGIEISAAVVESGLPAIVFDFMDGDGKYPRMLLVLDPVTMGTLNNYFRKAIELSLSMYEESQLEAKERLKVSAAEGVTDLLKLVK